MSDSDQIEVCPECGEPGFQTNVQAEYAAVTADAPYLCRECGTLFEEPDTRERRSVGGRRGLAGRLAAEDTDLATDGGHNLNVHPPEPDPGDPAQWCHECGHERAGMCACCGVPLCGKHLELGAGYCRDRVPIPTRVGSVPACIRTLADRREVVPDAPTFNRARPQRARLPPSEIERSVRERLPDALITRAHEHVQAALDELDQATAPTVIETLLAANDALRFGLTAPNPARRQGWLQTAVQALRQCLAALETATLRPPLRRAGARLEQLGAAAVDGGAADG